jgi:hypothetical protein
MIATMNRTLWKLYLAAMALLEIGGLGFYARQMQLKELLFELIFLLGLVGLYGYVYRKSLLNKLVWKYVFLFQLAVLFYTAYAEILKPILSESIEPGLLYWISVGISLLLSLPYLYGLFKYSYASELIWGKRL